MGKARVGVRLKEAVGGKKSHNRSQDLVKLTEQYNAFCKKLRGLIVALKNHHASMHQIAKTRLEVGYHLSALSKGSPLFDHTGQLPDENHSSDKVCSYLSVHEGVASKSKMYASKYAQFVVDYAMEWEKVVVSRISAGLKKAEQLRVETDHYQTKVESMRQAANQTMAKGKQVDTRTAEKLTRNEDKYQASKKHYEKFTHDLVVLIEEVTDRSWRDLHPLLVKVAQFDVTLSGDESKAMTTLNTVVNELKRVAVTHGIKPQARLKDLGSVDPNQLSTKAPGDPALARITNGAGGLSLDGGGALSPSSISGGLASPSSFGTNDDMHFPAGTVAPQGMGGFPVAIHSSDSVSNGHGGSFDGGSVNGSIKSAPVSGNPSTLDMMAINASAAPPPTVDQLAAAFGPTPTSSNISCTNGTIRSAPNSGGLSWQVPSGGGMRGRNQSIDSFDSALSGYSGASAPPPAAPPPPPPGDSFGGGRPPAPGKSSSFGAPRNFGHQPAPNPFGAPPAAAPNPFGAPPAAAPYQNYQTNTRPASYGAPPPAPGSYGAPPPSMYGGSNFAQQPSYGQKPPAYGQPPPMQPPPMSYGQPPPPSQFGQSASTNPFE